MKILGENHMSLSQIGAQISAFIAETSKSIFRKSAVWVFDFSTAKSIYYHGLSTQIFSKWFLDPCQPPRVFAWLASAAISVGAESGARCWPGHGVRAAAAERKDACFVFSHTQPPLARLVCVKFERGGGGRRMRPAGQPSRRFLLSFAPCVSLAFPKCTYI